MSGNARVGDRVCSQRLAPFNNVKHVLRHNFVLGVASVVTLFNRKV
jgi:hypothetical protein